MFESHRPVCRLPFGGQFRDVVHHIEITPCEVRQKPVVDGQAETVESGGSERVGDLRRLHDRAVAKVPAEAKRQTCWVAAAGGVPACRDAPTLAAAGPCRTACGRCTIFAFPGCSTTLVTLPSRKRFPWRLSSKWLSARSIRSACLA